MKKIGEENRNKEEKDKKKICKNKEIGKIGEIGENLKGKTFSSSKLLHDLRIYISKSDLTRR